MRKLILIIVIFSSYSCSNSVEAELDGKWYILEVTHNNSQIYPTKSIQKPRVTLEMEGDKDLSKFESLEKIEFINKYSEVVLPGFGNYNLHCRFSKQKEYVKFELLIPDKEDKSKSDLTREVYINKFKITKGKERGELILTSKNTEIIILSENTTLEDRRDGSFLLF